MTSRHPAVSCACPKCQSERRTTPTPAAEEREAVARALCIAGEEDDFNYKGYLELADAALSTLAQVRAAEILAAERERDALREALAKIANYDRKHKTPQRDGRMADTTHLYLQGFARAALTANHSAPVVEQD